MVFYSRDNARRSLIDTIAFRIVSQAATVLGYVVLVRGITEEAFGVLNILYAFIPVVGMLASFGLDQTLRRYQPEYLRQGNSAAAAWLVRFVASTRFGTNVICLSLILLAWNHFAPLFKLTSYKGEFVLFCFLVLLHFQASILQQALGSRMLHRYGVGAIACLAIIKLLGYSAAVWLDMLTLERAIVIDTVGYGAAYLLMRVKYARQVAAEQSASFRPRRSELKRLLRYGIFNNFNDLGAFALSTRLDHFFVAAFIDPIAVGVYAFYTRLNGMVANVMPVNLFGNVIQPMIFSMPVERSDERLPQYFALLINMNLLVQLPVLTFSTAYHAEIVEVIFGSKFIEYSWLLPMTLFFSTLNVIATPATLVAQYEEKAGIILLSKVFAIYNVLALLLLVPLAGVYGALLASRSAETFKNLFIWWHVRRRARWLHGLKAVACALGIWGGALGICYAAKALSASSPIAQMLLGAGICGAAGLLHLRSPAISVSDRTLLGTVLRGREHKLLNAVGLTPRELPRPAKGWRRRQTHRR